MAITRFPPNTIWLGGEVTQINDVAASAAITPGNLVERHVSTGPKWRKHATAAADTPRAVALDQNMLNKGVDDAYATGDLVEVAICQPGALLWMLIASGQTITAGQRLESAGDGTLRALAAGTALFVAVEDKTALALTRIKVEAM
jgi:hypothetical protein